MSYTYDLEKVTRLLNQYSRKSISFKPIYVDITGSVSSALLLSQIMYWMTVKDDTNETEFYKTNEELCKETRLGTKEFRNAKANLQKLGLININLRGLPAKSYYSVNYNVLIEKIDEIALNPNDINRWAERAQVDEPLESGGKSTCAERAQLHAPKGRNIYKEAESTYIEPPIVPQEGDDFLHDKKRNEGKVKESVYSKPFITFWETYPVKKGKDAAYRAFEKARKRLPVDELIERAKIFRKLRDEDKSEFIPNPSTWLSQGRWMDEEVEKIFSFDSDAKERLGKIELWKCSDDPWDRVCYDLYQKMGLEYVSWIAGKLFLIHIVKGKMVLGAESSFAVDRINRDYIPEIEKCVLKHYKNVTHVFVIHKMMYGIGENDQILIAREVE